MFEKLPNPNPPLTLKFLQLVVILHSKKLKDLEIFILKKFLGTK